MSKHNDDEQVFKLFPQKPMSLTRQEVYRSRLLHEADALITDACYLLSAEVGVEIGAEERAAWREHWLKAAREHLTQGGDHGK